MTNDCLCPACRRLDAGAIRTTSTRAKQRVYDQDGAFVPRGTPGVIEDIDSADRWLLVSFPIIETVICYPHEVEC